MGLGCGRVFPLLRELALPSRSLGTWAGTLAWKVSGGVLVPPRKSAQVSRQFFTLETKNAHVL